MDDHIVKKTAKKIAPKGKEARLAAALRENLRKRKTQQRERVLDASPKESVQVTELSLTQDQPEVMLDTLGRPSGQ